MRSERLRRCKLSTDAKNGCKKVLKAWNIASTFVQCDRTLNKFKRPFIPYLAWGFKKYITTDISMILDVNLHANNNITTGVTMTLSHPTANAKAIWLSIGLLIITIIRAQCETDKLGVKKRVEILLPLLLTSFSLK